MLVTQQDFNLHCNLQYVFIEIHLFRYKGIQRPVNNLVQQYICSNLDLCIRDRETNLKLENYTMYPGCNALDMVCIRYAGAGYKQIVSDARYRCPNKNLIFTNSIDKPYVTKKSLKTISRMKR